jgi:SNF2 family DNA or RNA helicase
MKTLSFSEFLAQHGPSLMEQARRTFPPLVPAPNPHLSFPGRRPMGAQAHAVAGAVQALKEGHRAAFLVGEMGTGKTFMGITGALNAFPKGRYLVLCPPHLVAKWAREARMEGAEAVILESPEDVAALRGKEGPLFAILSREKAKLGPGWRAAFAIRRVLVQREGRGRPQVQKVPVCPDCGRPVAEPEKAEKRRTACACGSPLWQVAPPRRESLYHALKRLLPRGFFHLLLLDEAHEYKGGDTAQALTAAGLIDWVGRTLLLTGTLFGGYASGLYHLLKRTLPEVREAYESERQFVELFGVLEWVVKKRNEEEASYGRYTRRGEGRPHVRERPGLSPLLLPFLLPSAAFVRLPEVAEGLPPYGEEVELLEMDPEHRAVYEAFAVPLGQAARKLLAQKDRRLLGALVQAGIQVPDHTFGEEAVFLEGRVVAQMSPMPEDYRHAKERALLERVRRELALGRRVLIYVQGTERRDQIARLVKVLQEGGVRAEGLRATTVAPDRREAWIAERVRKGLEALVLHPRIVQTGLDLIDFPTVVWYQPEYSVFTLRQASRRSWRIGQRHPVRVVFLAYRGTLQEAALSLIAQKTRASLALEGELVEGGLVAQAEEDPTLVLAKALAGAKDLSWEEGAAELTAPPQALLRPAGRRWSPRGVS